MIKKIIKSKIQSFIKDQIVAIYNEKFNIDNNPYRINFSDNSGAIYMPLQIEGGEGIYIGKKSRVGKHAWIGALGSYADKNYNPKILIGNNVMIGNYACITSINSITIKEGCLFSEYVYISDHAHGIDPTLNISPAFQNLNTKGPVVISENCFLGYRVSILPGVTLGRNCVVGAHSVVTKSFPDYSMIAGAPAQLIKKFNFSTNEWSVV